MGIWAFCDQQHRLLRQIAFMVYTKGFNAGLNTLLPKRVDMSHGSIEQNHKPTLEIPCSR